MTENYILLLGTKEEDAEKFTMQLGTVMNEFPWGENQYGELTQWKDIELNLAEIATVELIQRVEPELHLHLLKLHHLTEKEVKSLVSYMDELNNQKDGHVKVMLILQEETNTFPI